MRTCWPNPLLVIGMALIPVPLSAQSQPGYCAFSVTVKSPEGHPVAGARVEGLREDGEVFGSGVTDEIGVGRICDAPAGLVDLRVGGQLCGAVTIGHLRPYWMETRHVYITYANCSGEEWAPPGGCQLVLRIVDGDNSPIGGVLFAEPGARQGGIALSAASDAFGRLFRFIRYGETVTGSLIKSGYAPLDLSEGCKSGSGFARQRVVTLQKAPSDLR